jgi:bifunctional UDP-N-acetylglucosamine pyrophosphorylase/glucosamine-1-phosphate N-acetyltransferase
MGASKGPASAAVVLAAGMGKRMGLPYPKVLVRVGGRSALEHVLDTLRAAGIGRIVVVEGPASPRPSDTLAAPGLTFAVQTERRGTAHALLQAEPALHDFEGPLLVVNGDMPLISASSVRRLLQAAGEAGNHGALLVTRDPAGELASLGRVAVDAASRVERMVEARDLRPGESPPEHENAGANVFGGGRPAPVWEALAAVRPDNAQGELYLTDVVGILAARGLPMAAVEAAHPREALGINTPEDVARVEAALGAA